MEVVWSNESMKSLAAIYDYIFEKSPKNANIVFNTLLNLGNSLNDERFECSKDLILNDDRFKVIPKWNYKIIYERKIDKVVILDVFNTSQNPLNLSL